MRSVLVGAIYLFAIWALWTVVVGHQARQGVIQRATWARELSALQGIVGELRSGASPVDDALQIEAIDKQARSLLPHVVAGLADPPGLDPIPAAPLLDEVRAGLIAAAAEPKNPEPGLLQISAALDKLVVAVRQQNSALSQRLGTLWNGLNVLVLGALVFAYVTLSLHRQSVAQQQGLAALHAALEAELTQREADLLALQVARDRWERISRAVDDGIWEWRPTGQIEVSGRFLQMLGEPDAGRSLVEGEWASRIHPEDREHFSQAFEAHLNGFTPSLEIEYRIGHVDGRWRWVYCRGLAERGEAGEATLMVGAQTDITALREGAAAQERVAAIEHVTAAVGIGVLSLRHNHELISVSEAMHHHARPWGTVAHWWRAVVREAGAPDGAPCAECGARVPVGLSVGDLDSPHGERRVFALTWAGHDHGLDREEAPVVVMVKDITEEIELREDDEAARAQLARSKDELRDLLDRVPVGVALLRDDRLEYANAALIALLGGRFSPGLPWQEALPGAPEGAGLLELRRSDGSLAPVEASAPVAVTLDGRPASLRVVRDLSERRRMEAQLRVADRLSSIGAMAAGLSHEINNPLTYVIGNIELIRRAMERADRPIDRAAVAQRVERASEGLERVRSIVTELSTFARSDEADIEPVDINAVIDATLPLVTRMIQPRARFVRERVEVPRAIANRAWAGQIVLNLLLNAAYAIPPGAPDRNTVRLRTGVDGQGRVTIEVTDSGSGVPEAHVERIFDPFFTVRSVGEGSGLGLFVCQSLCQRMGGAVELVETGPAGTCMRVSLPCAALRPAVDEAAPAAAASRRGRVLVIDDEPDVTDIIAQFLQRHEVEVCHKGREATDKALGGDWDVILCDLMIPDRNGMEVYEAVRDRRPDLAERFTFITGGVLNADVARFLRETHRPHWIKPLDFGAVVAEVDVAVHATRKAS